MLSTRGEKLLGDAPPLVAAHFRCAADPYDARRNPGGYINLGTAENFLLEDLIEPRLLETLRSRNEQLDSLHFAHNAAHYDSLHGRLALRAALAKFLEEEFGAAAIDPESLIVTAGASPALDILTYALCDPGDAILVPAPYYSGFDVDLSLRAEARIVAVPVDESAGWLPTIGRLDRALRIARRDGVRVRALLINNPHNPLGTVLGEAAVRQLIDWAASEHLAIVFDEIYARSVHGEASFTSALKLVKPGERHVQVVSGFAKDFGLSGFKTGWIRSSDPDLTEALRQLVYLCPVGNPLQDMLAGVLADRVFLARFFAASRARLAEAYGSLRTALGAAGIDHLPAQAGIFAWLDLRKFLDGPDFAAEDRLRRKIFDGARLNIGPGSHFHAAQPGHFRLCFARPAPLLHTAVDRLKAALVAPVR